MDGGNFAADGPGGYRRSVDQDRGIPHPGGEADVFGVETREGRQSFGIRISWVASLG